MVRVLCLQFQLLLYRANLILGQHRDRVIAGLFVLPHRQRNDETDVRMLQHVHLSAACASPTRINLAHLTIQRPPKFDRHRIFPNALTPPEEMGMGN
jgi:hypothetical protein